MIGTWKEDPFSVSERRRGRLAAMALASGLAALAALTFVGSAFAGVETPIQVTSYPNDPGNNAKVSNLAINPATGKGMALVYVQDNGAGVTDQFQVQPLDETGAAEGAAVTIPTTSVGNSQNPTIAFNPSNGGWIACYWRENDQHFYCQQLNPDGSLKGVPIDVGSNSYIYYYGTTNVVWSSSKKKFLVEYTGWDESDEPILAKWLDPSNGSVGSEIVIHAESNSWGDTAGAGQMAYSPKSNTFLVVQRMQQVGQFNNVYFWLLDGNGEPIGPPHVGPLAGSDGGNNPSLAYNKARDEFVVVWINYTASFNENPLGLQRIDASDGSLVGDTPRLIPLDYVNYRDSTYRASIAASSTSDQLLVTLMRETDSSGYRVTALELFGDGAPAAGSEVEFPDQISSERPRVAFNPKSCAFITTFQGKEPVTEYRELFTGRYTIPSSSCPSAGGKPFLVKAGTPGARSLKVKVGCATGTSPCRIKLSGKLLGGSGTLKGKKVKASGKRTVRLTFGDSLIDELARDGGGKIKVKAKQVGGSTKTVVIAVPASVTG